MGGLQPADDVQGLHAAHGGDLRIPVATSWQGGDRVGDRTEYSCNDRLVEVTGRDLSSQRFHCELS